MSSPTRAGNYAAALSVFLGTALLVASVGIVVAWFLPMLSHSFACSSGAPTASSTIVLGPGAHGELLEHGTCPGHLVRLRFAGGRDNAARRCGEDDCAFHADWTLEDGDGRISSGTVDYDRVPAGRSEFFDDDAISLVMVERPPFTFRFTIAGLGSTLSGTEATVFGEPQDTWGWDLGAFFAGIFAAIPLLLAFPLIALPLRRRRRLSQRRT